jgi:uroporphyrinogen decarboxylase
MIQGRSEEGFPEVRKMMYQRPDLLKKVIDVNTAAVVAYLTEQIKAGAQALMLFDTWGGLLSAYDYERWSLQPMREIMRQLPLDASGHKVPVMLFTKGGGVWLKQMALSGADALGIDWTVDIKWAREQVGNTLCLQGNLDPQILFGRADVIDDAVDRLAEAVKGTQHIINLGHGILPGTPIEAVSRFVERIQEKTLRSHATVQSL